MLEDDNRVAIEEIFCRCECKRAVLRCQRTRTTPTLAIRALACSKRNDGLSTHDFRALSRLSGLLSEPNKGDTRLKRPLSLSEVDVVHRAACVAGTGRSDALSRVLNYLASQALSHWLCLQARGEAVPRSATVPE